MEENESIYKTFKYRIYPTPTQIEMFKHWFNADKWIWNYLIRKVFSEEFEEKNASRFKLRDDILDNGPSFLNRKTRKEVSDLLIDAAVHKFIMNYNLYKTMIRKDRTSIYSNSNTKYKPKLKYGSHTSCVLSKKNENTIQIRDGMLNMTTSKFYGRQTFKTKEEIKLDINAIKQVQFLKKDKKYFMCIVCKIEKKVKKTESKIGIDMGVKNFITSFNGKEYTEYNIPKKIFELCEKIDKLNKLYSNSKKDSKRGLKLKSKLNKLYKKQTNIKKDFIEKIIHELVNKYSEIIVEPFSWNKKRYNTFNRNVHLMSPSLFILRLEQKCLEYGVKLVIVKQGTPTTQTCSNCGNIKIDDDKLILKDRIYCCKKCGHKQDRDENAARNIYNYVV